MSPTAQSGRGAGVGDEASEGQQKYARESYEARSLLQPPFDGASSSPDCHETRESRRNPEDQDDVAQHAERLWRAGSRCHRDQDETKSDSDRSDDVERAGSDEVLGNPDGARMPITPTALMQRPNTNARVFTTSPSRCPTLSFTGGLRLPEAYPDATA